MCIFFFFSQPGCEYILYISDISTEYGWICSAPLYGTGKSSWGWRWGFLWSVKFSLKLCGQRRCCYELVLSEGVYLSIGLCFVWPQKIFFRGNCQLAFVGTPQASLGIPPDLANWHLLELAGVFQAAVIGVGRLLLLDSHWNWQVPPTWHLLAGS